MLKKTIETPRYKARVELVPPEGKTMDDVRETVDYAISEQLTKRVIAEQQSK